MVKRFNTLLRDSQGTQVQPVSAEEFDLQGYAEYEAGLLEKNKKFVEDEKGILVYRRVRANGVFYDKCRDYKESLALQLGALQKSLQYQADIANFLEPWYGIGYIGACFGEKYIWKEGQSPVVKPIFSNTKEILEADFKPIDQTDVGKYTLEMIEYFMEQTKGKVPISFCDIQSPLNMLSYLVPITELFIDLYDDPDTVKLAANLVSELLIEFLKKQELLIKEVLVKPGHGFASSRVFKGAGMSDDNSIMVQVEEYQNSFQEADEMIGLALGGTVYHSCGNWENKIDMVKKIKHMTAVDGAFSIETDPSPNDPFVFGDAFDGTGIVVNARVVGDAQSSFEAFKQIWRPQQKLIAVTYCENPKEQERLYRMLHELEEK